jgi:3-oxoacyl-(acyl-carrier-protein) synthase
VLAKQSSPRLFAYTLPSSPVGELSILHGLRGPGLAVVSGRSAGLEALAEAQALLQLGEVAACLVIAVEVAAPLFAAGAEDGGLADAAVALLLTRADSPLALPAAHFGYVLGTAAAYRAEQPTPALAAAAAAALLDAGGVAGTSYRVLGDAATQRYLPPELQARHLARDCGRGQLGAAAALQALMGAAAEAASCALVVSGEATGQAAAAMWSRSPR